MIIGECANFVQTKEDIVLNLHLMIVSHTPTDTDRAEAPSVVQTTYLKWMVQICSQPVCLKQISCSRNKKVAFIRVCAQISTHTQSRFTSTHAHKHTHWSPGYRLILLMHCCTQFIISMLTYSHHSSSGICVETGGHRVRNHNQTLNLSAQF